MRDDLPAGEFDCAIALPLVARRFGRLLREGADGSNAADHLGRGRAGLGVRLLHVGREDADAAAENRRGDDDRRHGEQRQQREPGGGVEQQRRSADGEDREAQRVGELLAEDELQRRHVGPQPRGDLAGVAAIEELDVLSQQRLEDDAAQARADAFRAEIETVVARERRAGFDEQDADHQERELVQSIEPSSLNALVDDEPNDLRVREPCSDAEQNEEHTGPIQPALGPHDGRDASKLAAHTVHSPIFVSFSSMHASSSWNLLPRSIGASH